MAISASFMPQKIRQILWVIGLVLTVLGLVLAIVMKNLGHENLMLMLPPSIGLVIIACLLLSGLIQDVVSDILQQVQETRRTMNGSESQDHLTPSSPAVKGASDPITDRTDQHKKAAVEDPTTAPKSS